jgi:small subunit ribosomal protein S9
MADPRRAKSFVGIGKRKTAIARAVVRRGSGRVNINGMPIELLRPESAAARANEPVGLMGEKASQVDIEVNVAGGGVSAQADAIRTSIANGLADYFGSEAREIFLETDRSLLVSDTRITEPKHPLGRKARKKRQKSYR